MPYFIAQVFNQTPMDDNFNPIRGENVDGYKIKSTPFETIEEAKQELQKDAAPAFSKGAERLAILKEVATAYPPTIDIVDVAIFDLSPELLTEEKEN